MSEMMDPTASDQAKHWVQFAIKAIHYAYPAQAFLYFLLALSITLCTLQTQRLRIQDQHVRRGVILVLILVAATTYLAEVITLVVKIFVMLQDEWYPDQDLVVYLIASSITFGAQALALTDSKFPVWYPYYGTWFFGLVVEVFLIVVPNVFDSPKEVFSFLSISIQALRICNFIVLISLYFGLRNDRKTYDNVDAERQSLLRKKLAPKPGSSEDTNGTTKANGYGATNGKTTNANAQDSEATEEASDAGSEDSWIAKQRKAQEAIDKRLQQDGNWFTYAKGFAIFFPYLWPYHSKTLQFRAVLVGFCLLGSNALNVLVPRQMGIMIDSLTKAAGGSSDSNVWIPIIVYTALKFVSGSAGIGWVRRWLWIPLEQYSYDALSTASHSHLMSLSSDFHDNKTSSDLTQAVHGGRSVADLLETVCFQVVPMFIDLTVAFAYLWSLFGPYMGLLMVATVVSYLYITTKLYSLRASKRRDYITIYRKEWTIGQQSLDGWGTASLFNMIPYERHRYACAVKDHMKAKRTYEMSSQAISAAQGLVISLGVLIALWLGAWQVVHGGKSTGQFTTLIFYWAQLQSPLIFFSTMYRQISYSLMDAERLLELFQTKPTIVDAPHAKPLKLGKGLVKFDQVSFAYDERKPTMKNVSFIVPSGKTVALVGETGGGKSTILKLIDRFYDVKSGCISIDDQDIRDVTVESLRENIGVVPQDPMLFNDSIMNNIRYARLSATDKEVYEACKAAAVHDKIMSFPDGYNSKVGDRGVKLSGGEKQRVAIARAILKQAQIILLDEATSAVDTDTEQTIQEGFKTLCQNRTTIIVAHRLSTVMNADHIIVVMSGEIVEEGSHEELIHKKGKYQNLWSKQLFVKPADERSGRCRSRSRQKRDANIINDLTPGRQTTELAKVLKTTPHEEPSKDEAAQDVGRESDSSDDPCVGHKREASKLKPDAPEFVPFRIKAPADLTSQAESKDQEPPSKINPKDAAKAQKKQEKDERKAASLAKKVGKKVGKQVDGPEDANNSTSNDQSAGPSSDQLTEGDTSAAEKSKRRPRFSRRHMARSEPPNQLQIQSDGQQDSDITAVSSGEGHSLLQAPASQRRRVTAPSDQPTNAQNRNRRSRHWRLQKRAAENAAAGSGSGTNISGEASTDELSSHLAPAPTPKTPQSTA